jgi:hypothetical protein
MPRIGHVLGAVVLMTACARPAELARDGIPIGETPAFASAARAHADELAALQGTDEVGLWLVQDRAGRLIASGVSAELPRTISSDAIGQVIPGAAGRSIEAFGFARTRAGARRPSVRVAYATVADSR